MNDKQAAPSPDGEDEGLDAEIAESAATIMEGLARLVRGKSPSAASAARDAAQAMREGDDDATDAAAHAFAERLRRGE